MQNRDLRTFSDDVQMTAGKIRLRRKGGQNEYRVTGWVIRNGDNVEMWAEDRRRTRPVFICKAADVEYIKIDLLT